MIPVPTGVRVWLATGYTGMRKGLPGRALQVQEVLHRDPLSGLSGDIRGCPPSPFVLLSPELNFSRIDALHRSSV